MFRPISVMLCVWVLVCPRLSHADPAQDTFDSAVFLLKSTTRVGRDGQHNMLLRAVRHMADPELAPLFDRLIGSQYTPLRVHGFLGAAECDPNRELDLSRIAALTNPAEQAQIISAAMDSDVLSNDQAQQIIAWNDLDNAIKVLVSTQLISEGAFKTPQVLAKAAESERPSRRFLALALMVQLDDDQALRQLHELDVADDRTLDRVRQLVLQAATRRELDRLGPWAMQLSARKNVRRKLHLSALRTAMRLSAPGATAGWLDEFDGTDDLLYRKRLALIALDLSPWLDVEFFEPLVASEDPFIHQLGLTGSAVADGPNVGDEVLALIDMNYPIANAWALRYAHNHAEGTNSTTILQALVKAYDTGPERGRNQRLDDAVSATQLLFERDPKAAGEFLRAALGSPQIDALLTQGILLGLIRAGTADPYMVIEGLARFENRPARNLALLLQARSGRDLSPEAIKDLGLMVRGGGLRQGALRIQAAWMYLKATGQTEAALAEVLKN